MHDVSEFDDALSKIIAVVRNQQLKAEREQGEAAESVEAVFEAEIRTHRGQVEKWAVAVKRVFEEVKP